MRAVQTLKSGMKKQLSRTKLSCILFHYRLTSHTTTGVAPVELLLKQRSQSHLEFVIPSIKDKIIQQLEKQTMQYDKRTQFHTFQQNDLVLIRDFNQRSNSKWLP